MINFIHNKWLLFKIFLQLWLSIIKMLDEWNQVVVKRYALMYMWQVYMSLRFRGRSNIDCWLDIYLNSTSLIFLSLQVLLPKEEFFKLNRLPILCNFMSFALYNSLPFMETLTYMAQLHGFTFLERHILAYVIPLLPLRISCLQRF